MSLNLDKIAEELARAEKPAGGNQNDTLKNYVRMPQGDGVVVLRILPPMEGQDLFFASTRTHQIGDRRYHCLRENTGNGWKGNCPACDAYSWYFEEVKKNEQSLSKSEIEDLKSRGRKFKPNERYYYNVIVRGEEGKPDSDPLIFSLGKELHNKVLKRIIGDPLVKRMGLKDVTDVNNGRDLIVVCKVKSGSDGFKFPSYDESEFTDQSPLSTNKKQTAAWLGSMHDIFAIRKLKPYEEVATAVAGFRSSLDGVMVEAVSSNPPYDGGSSSAVASKSVPPKPYSGGSRQTVPTKPEPAPFEEDTAIDTSDFLSDMDLEIDI